MHSHIETSNYCILKFQTRVWADFVLSNCNNCTANEFTNLSLTVYRSGGIVFLQTDKRLHSRRIHYKTDAYGSYIANCLFLLECLGTAWQTGNVITRNEGLRERRMAAPFLSSFSQTSCLQWRLIQSYFQFKTCRFWKKARNGAGGWQRTWDGFSCDISLVSRPEQIKTR